MKHAFHPFAMQAAALRGQSAARAACRMQEAEFSYLDAVDRFGVDSGEALAARLVLARAHRAVVAKAHN